MRLMLLTLAWFGLAGCGLEASAPAKTNENPVAAQQQAPSGSYLDQDLPPPPATMAITQRAMNYISDPNLGFVGWIAATSDCYAALEPSDLEARVYCLQMDAIAWSLENAVQAEWRERDAESNDYFTDARFLERQTQFAPPNDPTLSVEARQRRKSEALQALAVIRNMAMEEAVRRMQEQRSGQGITP
jgi:hypothetical protein